MNIFKFLLFNTVNLAKLRPTQHIGYNPKQVRTKFAKIIRFKRTHESTQTLKLICSRLLIALGIWLPLTIHKISHQMTEMSLKIQNISTK